MTEPPSLFQRLRSARIVQVLVVYLASSWVVLQVVETLTNTLGLPEWVGPVALILLLIGLVVILSTAWIQASPVTRARVQAGELPGTWQIEARGLLQALRQGRLPHLTWGRAVLGGMVAFWFLFGLAGLWVLVGTPRLSLGPAEAGADEAAAGLAVVPFTVSGPELEVWREGMVDLLATNLDGVGGLRTINARTVMARWREVVGSAREGDLELAMRAAARTGARYLLMGSVVGLGEDVRLLAEVYDLDSRQAVGRGRAEGSPSDMLALVDRLSVEVVRSFLSEQAQGVASDRTAALATHSLPALTAYLEGEARYRRSDFAGAIAALERALEADSTFAQALYRISEAYGWLEAQQSERGRAYAEAAVRHADRLPERDRLLLLASRDIFEGGVTHHPEVLLATRKYPDDPEAWWTLAEYHMHMSGPLLAPVSAAREPVERAIALDPSFAPYYLHLAELQVMAGDLEGWERTRAAYQRVAPGAQDLLHPDLMARLRSGDEATVASARADLESVSLRDLAILNATFSFSSDDLRAPAAVLEVGARRFPANLGGPWMRLNLTSGRLEEFRRLAASASPVQAAFIAYDLHAWGLAEPRDRVAERLEPSACRDGDGHATPPCQLVVGAYLAETGRRTATAAIVAEERREAEALGDEEEPDRRHARAHAAVGDALDAYAAWLANPSINARRALENALPRDGALGGSSGYIRFWVGKALVAEGRLREALPYFLSLDGTPYRPFSQLRVGEIREELGEREAAAESYRAALVSWRDADEGFAPAERARAGLARVGGTVAAAP